MRQWSRLFIISILGLVALSSILVWVLPAAINQMPGRYRYYLPSRLLDAVTTPLPTALPAPNVATPPAALAIATLPQQTPIQPTATILPTTAPTTTAEAATTAVSTPLSSFPTPIPATLTPSATPTATIDPLPTQVQIDGLQIIPQKFNNCGPTNLTIALTYFGIETDQFAVAAHVRPHYEDRNVSPWELAGFVEQETPLQATVYSGGTLRQLKALLAEGLPVIVEKGLVTSEDEGWIGHYLTLSGYDEQTAVFYTLDTLLGPWEGTGDPLPYDELLPFWQQFNHTLLVVYPPEKETAVSQILHPLDPALMWHNAATDAQAELAIAPENPFAWFNLGTSLARLGQLTSNDSHWQNAAIAFDQARLLGLPPRMLWYQFQPYEAYLQNGRYEDVLTLTEATLISQGGRSVEETHYYQGEAYRTLGDVDRAHLAYKRALGLRPTHQKTLEAIAALNND